jgi:hypothetical protein
MPTKRTRDDHPRVPSTSYPSRETFTLRDLLCDFGLDDVASRVSSRLRCRLAPQCRTTESERACIRAGVPAVCSAEDYAGEVFNALDGADGVAWATTSSWSRFGERGKVCMVSGWGAPGAHVLSDRRMRLVGGFDEVIASDDALNLQMFHRDDVSDIPVLPRKLKWPDEGRYFEVNGEDAPGRLLDDATRVSAAGAMTWWHLDDCGEFVCQVGLPEVNRECGNDVLLGPNGKPVVKLFFFAERRDYAWIAQDAEMNKSMRNCALDLFDTPGHYFPTSAEMRAPSAEGLNVDAPKAYDGAGDVVVVGDDADDPCPTLWVAALEAGGPPLLSPPNLIHCVLTVRDCVMVEERRLSLAFMDEVLYFQRRATRWCEPPIFYAFLREDLSDAKKARRGAVEPLVRFLQSHVDRGDGAADAAAHFARCFVSLRVLAEHAPEFYALDADGVRFAKTRVAEFQAWMDAGADDGGFAAACKNACTTDPRVLEDEAVTESMVNESLGVLRIADDRLCAVVHEKGRPRWGPVRATKSLADADRKAMRESVRKGTLDALLRAYRREILGGGGDEEDD